MLRKLMYEFIQNTVTFKKEIKDIVLMYKKFVYSQKEFDEQKKKKTIEVSGQSHPMLFNF
jgi:hypothetical protein